MPAGVLTNFTAAAFAEAAIKGGGGGSTTTATVTKPPPGRRRHGATGPAEPWRSPLRPRPSEAVEEEHAAPVAKKGPKGKPNPDMVLPENV